MSVRKKLLISYVAFLLPVAVLVFFMDISFAYDINVGREERIGLRYTSVTLDLLHHISHQWVDLMAGQSEAQPFHMVNGIDRRESIKQDFENLLNMSERHRNVLELTPATLKSRNLGHIVPSELRKQWRRFSEDPTDEHYRALIQDLRRFFHYVSETSRLTQDPALDSNALVRAVIGNLPDFHLLVSDIMVNGQQGYVERGNFALREQDQFRIASEAQLAKNVAFEKVVEFSKLALREDPRFYGTCNTLQEDYPGALATFRASTNDLAELFDYARMQAEGPVTWSDLFQQGLVLQQASMELFRVGVESLDILIDRRLESYWTWRLLAAISSVVALLLVGVLVVFTSRGVNGSINTLMDYTRRVSSGDHDASVAQPLGEDLDKLYSYIRNMLAQILRLAAFPQKNPNPVLAADAQGRIVYENDAGARFRKSVGMTLKEFLPDGHTDVVRSLVDESRTETSLEVEAAGHSLLWSYYPILNEKLVHIYVRDTTEQKKAERQLLHDAFHDALTGLPNRALFMDRLSNAIDRHEGRGNGQFAVMILDIDRFKIVNDSLGHLAGDRLLKQFAQRLRGILRPNDTLARLGGDEFAVLLDNLLSSRQALHVAERVNASLDAPFALENMEIQVSVSLGVVLSAGRILDTEGMLRDADTAMYQAKAQGRARYEVFDKTMHDTVFDSLHLELDLKRCIERDELGLAYQPIVELGSGRLAGFEALVRWNHPRRGTIFPDRFIPLAEETGFINAIGMKVLEEACSQAGAWMAEFASYGELLMSVNLSARQFSTLTLPHDIERVLEGTTLRPDCLRLEITESGLMQDVDASMTTLAKLKELGVKLGIDDFGTGYSSLSYLHRYPFDFLKVDKSFVMRMGRDRESYDIVSTIIALAHQLGKEVVAEGVEGKGELDALRELGSEYGQGYLFAKPVTGEEASRLLATDERW